MIIYIALTLLALLYVLFVFVTWNEYYWIKQGIPSVEPKRIFGNVKDVVLMKRTIGEVYQEIYRQLEGKPLGGFFKMRQPILMVRDPDLVREVLNNKFNCFHDNDIHIRSSADPILKMNPFLAKGPTWEAMRSVTSSLQQNDLLEGLLQIMKVNCMEMVKYLSDQQLPVEVKELCSKYTSDVIASCALGFEVNSFKKHDDKFKDMSDKLIKKDFKSNAALLFALYAPFLGNWLNFRIISLEVAKYFIGLVSERCKYRVREGIRRKDFLQRLIDINKESEANGEGAVYNYDQITGHCMTIFLDGYTMTSHPLSFCFYELALHPEVQEKLNAELRQNGIISIKDLSNYAIQNLEYLDKVLSESLRLHLPMETITRLCTTRTELSYGGHTYPIEKGISVTIPIQALHMDPAYFSNPKEFKPDRFSKEECKKRHPYVYLPFGAGPRECPGSKFAKLVLKVALIGIILNFDIVPRGSIQDLDHEPMSSLITEAKGMVWLRFKKKL